MSRVLRLPSVGVAHIRQNQILVVQRLLGPIAVWFHLIEMFPVKDCEGEIQRSYQAYHREGRKATGDAGTTT